MKQVTQDFLGKRPGEADGIRYMVYATVCSGLRDDKTLPEAEKAARALEYGLALLSPPQRAPAVQPAARPPKKTRASVKMNRMRPSGALVAVEKTVVAIAPDGAMVTVSTPGHETIRMALRPGNVVQQGELEVRVESVTPKVATITVGGAVLDCVLPCAL